MALPDFVYIFDVELRYDVGLLGVGYLYMHSVKQ